MSDLLPYRPDRPRRRWIAGAGVLTAVAAAWVCGLLIERASPGMIGRVAAQGEAFLVRLLR